MIDRAVSLVTSRLDQHLRQRFEISEEIVAVSGLTDAEGRPASEARNRLVAFIVGISEETNARIAGKRPSGNARSVVVAEPIYLNLDLMIASNFDPLRHKHRAIDRSDLGQHLRDRPDTRPNSKPRHDLSDRVGLLWGAYRAGKCQMSA